MMFEATYQSPRLARTSCSASRSQISASEWKSVSPIGRPSSSGNRGSIAVPGSGLIGTIMAPPSGRRSGGMLPLPAAQPQDDLARVVGDAAVQRHPVIVGVVGSVLLH